MAVSTSCPLPGLGEKKATVLFSHAVIVRGLVYSYMRMTHPPCISRKEVSASEAHPLEATSMLVPESMSVRPSSVRTWKQRPCPSPRQSP
jgi:hypothetical protein